MIKNMDMELSSMEMEIDIKVIGEMDKDMIMESISIQMEISIRENGKQILKKDMES